ncbi:hypothetical protein MRX96_053588, partial [Rhipicephalus microplus]
MMSAAALSPVQHSEASIIASVVRGGGWGMVAVVLTTVPLTLAALIGTALIVSASSWSTTPSSRRAAALLHRANSLSQAAELHSRHSC